MITKRTLSASSIVYLLILLVLSLLILSGCGDSESKDPSKFSNSKTVSDNSASGSQDLSDFELEHGIGPIKQIIELSAIDMKLVKIGEEIFSSKCATCHKLDERYVGPAQRDVLVRRSPEFIMNMMLNPEEMYKRHPDIKKMLAEYMTPMPNQNLSHDDARAVLEYFRKIANEK